VNPTPDSKSITEPERQLLVEGFDSFVPAVSAVLAFRKLIQSRCRQAVEKRRREYSKALGMPVERAQVEDSDYPRLGEWDGTWASVGVLIKKLGGTETWLYHTLEWNLGEKGEWVVEANASIWLPRGQQVDRFRELLRQHAPESRRWDEGNDIGLWESVSSAEAAVIDASLDSVLCGWIAFWERVGGMKPLIKSGTI
jgi:hypothetical protein